MSHGVCVLCCLSAESDGDGGTFLVKFEHEVVLVALADVDDGVLDIDVVAGEVVIALVLIARDSHNHHAAVGEINLGAEGEVGDRCVGVEAVDGPGANKLLAVVGHAAEGVGDEPVLAIFNIDHLTVVECLDDIFVGEGVVVVEEDERVLAELIVGVVDEPGILKDRV